MKRATSNRSRGGKPPQRDPQRTQERIIAAALKEFCDKGLAGARVDSIAHRARINKRMLYHYFGNKNDLFREVLHRKMAQRTAWLAGVPDDPFEVMPYWYNLVRHDVEWLRLLEWEALERPDTNIINQVQRKKSYGHTIQRLQDAQKAGRLSDEFDARQLSLSMTALNLFPLAFPQLTRIITGKSYRDADFQRARMKHLGQMAAALRAHLTGGRKKRADSPSKKIPTKSS